MIDAGDKLPVQRQCALLDVARSTAYYRPQPSSEADHALMRRMDAIHLARPFLGSRRIVDALSDEGVFVNRKRVQRLMQIMGLIALYPKPRTSRPAPGHRIVPYLLRDLTIDRPNQVWCTDITYCAPSPRRRLKDYPGLEHVWNVEDKRRKSSPIPAFRDGKARAETAVTGRVLAG